MTNWRLRAEIAEGELAVMRLERDTYRAALGNAAEVLTNTCSGADCSTCRGMERRLLGKIKQALTLYTAAKLTELEVRYEWISVADRLPEVDGKYLCWIEETPPWPSSGCVVLDFDRREEPVWSSNASRYITHWMPLPAAPEDKS